MTSFQTFFQKLNSFALSPDVSGRIKSTILTDQANDFLVRLSDIADNNINASIPIVINDSMFIVDSGIISSLFESGSSTVELTKILPNGSLGDVARHSSGVVLQAIGEELDLARVEAAILPALLTVSGDTSIASLCDSVRSLVSSYGSVAAQELISFMNYCSVSSKSALDLADQLLSYLLESDVEDGAVFRPTKLGKATATSGLALWCNVDFTDLASVVTSCAQAIGKSIKRFAALNLQANLLNQQASQIQTASLMYMATNIFADEYCENNNSWQDLSFNNGFVKLGVVSSDALKRDAALAGVSRSAAMAIPSLGATWYLYHDEEDRLSIGAAKHLYEATSATYILRRLGATGNTFTDITALLPILRPVAWASETSVGALNDRWATGLIQSEKLITAGLLALSGEELNGLYYQDVDPSTAASWAERWTSHDLSSNPISTREDFCDEVMFFGADGNFTFAQNQLSLYLNHYLSTSANYAVQHLMVANPLRGAYTAMDDAETVASITTSVNSGFAIVGAALVASAVIVASRYVKDLARDAVVQAQRMMCDTSVEPTVAYRAMRKANFLSRISGIPTGVVSDVVTSTNTSGLREILNGDYEEYEPVWLPDLRYLIKGE